MHPGQDQGASSLSPEDWTDAEVELARHSAPGSDVSAELPPSCLKGNFIEIYSFPSITCRKKSFDFICIHMSIHKKIYSYILST